MIGVSLARSMRLKLVVGLLLGVIIISVGLIIHRPSHRNSLIPVLSATPKQVKRDNLLLPIANSLLNMHEQVGNDWRFRSAIQAPHYQTDRDVGAAGIGMGFL